MNADKHPPGRPSSPTSPATLDGRAIRLIICLPPTGFPATSPPSAASAYSSRRARTVAITRRTDRAFLHWRRVRLLWLPAARRSLVQLPVVRPDPLSAQFHAILDATRTSHRVQDVRHASQVLTLRRDASGTDEQTAQEINHEPATHSPDRPRPRRVRCAAEPLPLRVRPADCLAAAAAANRGHLPTAAHQQAHFLAHAPRSDLSATGGHQPQHCLLVRKRHSGMDQRTAPSGEATLQSRSAALKVTRGSRLERRAWEAGSVANATSMNKLKTSRCVVSPRRAGYEGLGMIAARWEKADLDTGISAATCAKHPRRDDCRYLCRYRSIADLADPVGSICYGTLSSPLLGTRLTLRNVPDQASAVAGVARSARPVFPPRAASPGSPRRRSSGSHDGQSPWRR